MTAQFLTPAWCDTVTATLRDDAEATGLAAWANLTLQYEISDVPGSGMVRYYRRFADGEVTFALGDHPDAEITMSFPYDVAVEINHGTLDVPTAFGQGRLTIDGELAPLMQYQSEMLHIATTVAAIPTEY